MSENKNDTLQSEMENLAATFQSEYDKASAEADAHPLIQELEEIVEEEEDEPAETESPAKKKKTKKKEKKTGKKKVLSVIGSIVSFLLVIVLMAVTVVLTFVASSFTDFDSYLYSIRCAESVEAAEAKIGYYQEGLAYLENDLKNHGNAFSSLCEPEMQSMHELITVCTVETEGYAAAMSYMHQNLTEEQIASPRTAEFKEFMKIAKMFESVGAECISKVEEAGANADFAAIAASYTTDETLAAAVAAILENVSEALTAEKENDLTAAGAAYEAALAGLAEYSTKSQALTERYVLCIAQTKGYAAALTYATANLTAEQLASPVAAEFSSFTGVADILADLSAKIYETAKDKVGDSAELTADFTNEIAALSAPAYMTEEITALFENVAGGLAKINAGAYASAVEMLTAAADSFKGYGCPSDAVNETVVIATAYANGYAEALAYANKNITAAEYTPATEEYAAFLAAAEVFASLDSEQFSAVSTAVEGLTDANDTAIDLSAVVSELSIPECLTADAQTILTNIARAVISENNADSKAALDYYKTVSEDLSAIGCTGKLVYEKLAVLTGKTEDLHAAYTFINENKDVLAQTAEEALTEDFAALRSTLDNAFSAEKVNAFIENAKTALTTGDIASVKIEDVIAQSGIDASVADFYKAYFTPLSEAIAAEKDKNLTLVTAKYEELCTLLANDAIALPNALLEGIISASFKSGDLQTAVTYCTNYIDMETLAESEFKTLCETVQLCDAAMQKSTNVLQQAYYSSYYGSVPAQADLEAQFEALLTEDSNNYDKAFNYYNRYVSELYFYADDADSLARQLGYLEKVQELIPDQIFIYGYPLLQSSISDGDYEGAKEIANKMLAINAYDDVALGMLAKIERINGDLEAAAAYVEKGLAGKDAYECERQNIVLCMLNGNFADAYDSVIALYDRGLATMNECETIAVYAALFTDANDEQKTKLNEIVSYIENDLYGQYGYTYSENTTALIDGTKTLNDVFMAEPYDLW